MIRPLGEAANKARNVQGEVETHRYVLLARFGGGCNVFVSNISTSQRLPGGDLLGIVLSAAARAINNYRATEGSEENNTTNRTSNNDCRRVVRLVKD